MTAESQVSHNSSHFEFERGARSLNLFVSSPATIMIFQETAMMSGCYRSPALPNNTTPFTQLCGDHLPVILDVSITSPVEIAADKAAAQAVRNKTEALAARKAQANKVLKTCTFTYSFHRV